MITSDFRMATRGFRAADIDELASLLDGLPGPCWASGLTAGALYRFDGFTLSRPFDAVVLRGDGRGVRRAHHRVHTTTELGPLDVGEVHGIPVLSPTRTIIDLAAMADANRLEALGYRWHRSTAQMEADARRSNRLQLDGFIVIQVTYQAVVAGAAAALADLSEALAAPARRTA